MARQGSDGGDAISRGPAIAADREEEPPHARGGRGGKEASPGGGRERFDMFFLCVVTRGCVKWAKLQDFSGGAMALDEEREAKRKQRSEMATGGDPTAEIAEIADG